MPALLFLIPVVIAGLLLFLYGTKTLHRLIRVRDIINFPLTDKVAEFQIKKRGIYSVSVVGTGYIKSAPGFLITINGVDNHQEIHLKNYVIKSLFRRGGRTAIKYREFKIDEPGNYKIEFKNIDKLSTDESILRANRIFQTAPVEDLEILIRDSVSIKKSIPAILFTVIGIYLLYWSLLVITQS